MTNQFSNSFLSRRIFLIGLPSFGILRACAGAEEPNYTAATPPQNTEESNVDWASLTDAEWKARLTPMQYYVLREEGTERAGTSPLDKEYREGTFHCAGCDLPLFSSETKYDSRTGWPSFWKPLDDALGTKSDRKLWYTRTEYHCIRCKGHQGHVFEDGPRPTGLRYCNNGVALTFRPNSA